MNKTTVSFLLFCAIACSSCGGEKQEEKTREEKEQEYVQREQDERNELIRFANTHFTDSCTYKGHRYCFTIDRQASDSLGIITDADGFRTVNNSIALTVSCDGTRIFSHVYTRGAFKIGINDKDFSHYVLMNMVFDRMTPVGPRFAVTVGVGSADDNYVQFALTVAPDGTTNIVPREVYEEDEIDRFEELV
ncbi:MAG: DUF4738 domain-containing protein [Bacteroidales bacterium]|nr:DUF4738 domain-containing protein [Candidatus Physcousia equi]